MPKDNTAYGPSSNPSSKSYAGGGGGGGGVSTGKTTTNTNSGSIRGGSPLASLSRLATAPPTTGVTTGKTIYGNTAYGPSGGMATGYATRSGPISGMGPSVGTYSNFRNLDGSAAIPGAGNMTAMGRNAFQARSQLQRMYGGPPRVGGLLSGEEVSVGPVAPPRRIVPTAMPIPRPPQAITGPWPGQAINPYIRNMATKYLDRLAPTVPSDVNLMGGLGMPGLSFRPAGYVGGFTQEQKDYYRGDTPEPAAWRDFKRSVSDFMGTMKPMGQ